MAVVVSTPVHVAAGRTNQAPQSKLRCTSVYYEDPWHKMSGHLLGAEASVVKEKRARGGGGSPFLPDPRAKDDSVESQFSRLSGMLEEDGGDKASLLGESSSNSPKWGRMATMLSCCACCSDEDRY